MKLLSEMENFPMLTPETCDSTIEESNAVALEAVDEVKMDARLSF